MSYEQYSEASEQYVIAALFANGNEHYENIRSILKPEDFYSKQNADIYRAVIDTNDKKGDLDSFVIGDLVNAENGFSITSYIDNLSISLKTCPNAVTHSKRVADESRVREMIAAHEKSIAKLRSGDGTATERLHHSIANVNAINPESSHAEMNAKHIGEFASQWLDSYEARLEGNALPGITLGLDDIDEIIGPRGSLPGDVVAISARPKMGKTALAMKIADHIAINLKRPVMIFSMEMAGEQLCGRAITQESGVSNDKFYRQMSDSDTAKVHKGIGELLSTEMYIDDRKGLTIVEIEIEARNFVKKQGGYGSVAAMFVDYLTLIKMMNPAMGKAAAYAEISMRLTALAAELGLVMFPLAQLNKQCEGRPDKRPLSTDMGDTDQVIRDCSISLFLYKDSVYNSESAMGSITEVIMRDNRNGDTGTGYQNMNKGQFVDVNPSEIGRIIAEAEYQEAQAKSKKAY